MKNNKTVDKQSIRSGMIIGVSAGLVTTLLASSIFAWLLNKEILQEYIMNYGTGIILLLSSIIAARIAVSIAKRKKLLVSILTGSAYVAILLACTALLFAGEFQNVGVTTLIVLAGCISAALIGLKVKEKHIITKHNHRNR